MPKLQTYPPELTDPVWKKKKSVTAGETGIGKELVKLKTAYDGIKWAVFDAVNEYESLKDLQDNLKGAEDQYDKVKTLMKSLGTFQTLATSKAGTMKALTNKGTKTALEAMSAKAKSLSDHWKLECETRIKDGQKNVNGYKDRLKDWIKRKEDLCEDMKKSYAVATIQMNKVKELAAANDKDAKAMPKDPGAAKVMLEAMAGRVAQISKISSSLKQRNEEMHKLFAPHRTSAENPTTHNLGTGDTTAKYNGVFTKADDLRKEMVGMQELMDEIFKDAMGSIKEAQATTLSGAAQGKAYEQIAKDLATNHGSVGKRMSELAGAKTIVGPGKEYGSTYGDYLKLAQMGKPNKETAKAQAKDRAKQRFDQVNDLEKQLAEMYNTSFTAFNKAVGGIPENLRQGDLNKMLLIASQGIEKGKDFLDQWKEANKKGTAIYNDVMKQIDQV